MTIDSFALSVRKLFGDDRTFEVPDYQRGYSWDDEAISDFVGDLGRCLNARVDGSPRKHFFGGIVAYSSKITNSPRANYHIVDGQQRMASFAMLAWALYQKLNGALAELKKKEDAILSPDEKKAKDYFEQTAETLRTSYLMYRDEIALVYTDVPRMKLSEVDESFFRQLVGGGVPTAERNSHDLLKDAWTRIGEFVSKEVFKGEEAVAQASRVQQFIGNVLVEDCSVVFIAPGTQNEAIQIFQVLNDRGVQLTDGDLLRSSTLALLKGHSERSDVAKAWDDVLAYPASHIEKYLRWHFASVEGERPAKSGLSDQYLDTRFKMKDKTTITGEEAKGILTLTRQLDDEFYVLEELGEGHWPYESEDSKIFLWDKQRLKNLVTRLKHENAMPLLLSLSRLSQDVFGGAVAILERFFFRYKVIGKAHVTPMDELYHRHSKAIRSNPGSYKLPPLREELAGLVTKYVPDPVFDVSLRQLTYERRTGNAPLRYFLATLEDYADWYDGGAKGEPKCKDKSMVIDLSMATIEHVYPRAKAETDKDASLEPLKDTIGNLTVLGPGDNDSAGAKDFAAKKDIFKKSKLKMNRDIAEAKEWNEKVVKERENRLVDMAKKIFVP